MRIEGSGKAEAPPASLLGCQSQPWAHGTLPAPMQSDRDAVIPTLPVGKSKAQSGVQGLKALSSRAMQFPRSPEISPHT